jgi:RAD51-like protein 2
VDRLIQHFTNAPSSRHISRKGKERAGTHASILPGTSLEISGPPGSGKTAFAVAVALSARLGNWDPTLKHQDLGEVLLVGER